ncbi:hypothetical protein CCHR01_16601, partial [Colletotrichum chrysophilum]
MASTPKWKTPEPSAPVRTKAVSYLAVNRRVTSSRILSPSGTTAYRLQATRFVNMKSMQILAPAAGLFAVANAWGTDVHTSYTTIVTTAYETYCPSPTTFVHHNVTYTATTATTLTITNCPCTITTHQPPPYTTTKTLPPPPPHANTTTTSCPPDQTTICPAI